MHYKKRGASLTGYGLIVGLISIVALGAVTSSGDNVKALFTTVGDEMNAVVEANGATVPAATPTPIPVLASCLALLNNDPLLTSGAYTIDPDGSGGTAPFTVFCDMDTDGGGWTMVSHVYDNDNSDDIPNNSGGAAWGDPNTTPTANSSFNIAQADTPSFTEAFFDWRFPLFGDAFSHTVTTTVAEDRFNWSTVINTVLMTAAEMDNLTAGDGRINGVFGGPGHDGALRVLDANCAGGGAYSISGPHYWGFGSVIGTGNNSTGELHNLPTGIDRASGTSQGCGTRESIFNIWVR